jgi:hypothetical protein
MKHETADKRKQHRCVKDVSMTCSHLNKNDDHIVTLRNYSSNGVYFESDKEALIGSFVVIRAVGSHDGGAIGSPSEHPYQFTIEQSDPGVCWGYRSHTVAKVIRCDKVDDDTKRFGVGAEVLILSD